jgi:excinuclease UvrABC ATPase subunit
MQLVQELLVNSEGMELYIVDPARLGYKVGDVATFAEVRMSLRQQGEHNSLLGVF